MAFRITIILLTITIVSLFKGQMAQDIQATPAELSRMEAVLEQSEIFRKLQDAALAHDQQTMQNEADLNDRIQQLEKRLEASTKEYRNKLNSMQSKIARMESKLGIKVQQVVDETASKKHWLMPFALLVIVVVTITVIIYSKYRRLVKLHVL
uniref:Uncharacterized protein n=1 Tax=Fibrocapsa japonica TaxID=94617 RepID=A0A7S2XYC6_9STRA